MKYNKNYKETLTELYNQYHNLKLSSKDQSRVFTDISDVFKPRILSKMQGYNRNQRDEIWSQYQMQILDALRKYKPHNEKGAQFSTFLYNYINWTIPRWYKLNNLIKENNTTTNIISMDELNFIEQQGEINDNN